MRRLLVAALPVLLLGWSTAPLESGDQPERGHHAAPTIEVLDHDAALLRDATTMATAQGQSVEAALRALRFQEDVGRLTNSLPPESLANSYAGGALTAFPEPRADLYFKGEVPGDVAGHFAAGGLAGVRVHGGMKYNLTELAERTSAYREAASRLGFSQITAGVDVTTQQVTVEVVQPEGVVPSDGVELAGAISADAAPGLALDADDLKVVEHPAGTQLVNMMHGYGGAGLRDDGVRECTGSFIVRRPRDGTEGPLVAAHCEGINRIEENNTSGGVNLTFQAPFVAEHIGWYGDVEWHTTVGHDDFPQFWADTYDLRWVDWRAQPGDYYQSAYVCKYGRVGGYGCGSISLVYFEIEVTWEECLCDILAQNMVQVEMERCCVSVVQGGDSGGPWFLGTGAYGITSGATGVDPRDGHQLAWFSRVANAEAAFAVTVQTR
jgi:streptogrisin C